MRELIVAIQFLTRLPTPRVRSDEAMFARSMRCFPAVGLLIGLLVAGAGHAGNHIDPWSGALAALFVWIAVTGALHLDGLADLADASGAAHKDRAALLAVLADPHVGSFGVVAIVLQLLAKLVLLHAAIGSALWPAIILIPAVARFGPLVWTLLLPSLHDGLAARFRSAVRFPALAFWSVMLVVAAARVPALLAAPMLFGLGGAWLVRRIGGISGDGHGAGIELVETGLLIVAIVAAALG